MSQQDYRPIHHGYSPGRPALGRIGASAVQDLAISELATRKLSSETGVRIWRAVKESLSEEKIREIALEFRRIHGKFPTVASQEPVPTMEHLSWSTIDSAGRSGRHGLPPGQSLSKIIAPLRDLCEASIIEAARVYHAQHGRLPNSTSTEELPNQPGITWSIVDGAGRRGRRGLAQGRTLSVILAPLREEVGATPRGPRIGTLFKPALSESAILEAGREYFLRNGLMPDHHSKGEVPGMPDDSWGAINQAGQDGYRGLAQGRTLAKILAPLRAEFNLFSVQLTKEMVLDAARKFCELHGKLPTSLSEEPVPGLPDESWRKIAGCAYYGRRGLAKEPLHEILQPLRDEFGLSGTVTEEMIISAAKEHLRLYGRFPTQLSTEPVPGMPKESWNGLQDIGWRGARGLKAGRTLSKILKPIRDEWRAERERAARRGRGA